MEYTYTALDELGTEVSGRLSHTNEGSAYDELRRRMLYPLAITPVERKCSLKPNEYLTRETSLVTISRSQSFFIGFFFGILTSLILAILISQL